MPLYCENCMKLVEGPTCRVCRNRKLREVRELAQDHTAG